MLLISLSCWCKGKYSGKYSLGFSRESYQGEYNFLSCCGSLLIMNTMKAIQDTKRPFQQSIAELFSVDNLPNAGLLIFRGKKSKILRDFQGQIRGKIGRFRGIFAGRKSKFAERSADFWYFCKKKSKFAEKSADFAGFSRKKVKFRRIFRGKFLEISADFTGNFGGKPRHETISKKQPISLDFGGEISLKSINFASI